IAETRYALCASPAYFKQQGIPKKIDELMNHLYIGHKFRPIENTINLINKTTLNIKPYLLLNNTDVMLQAAKQGLGLVQLHKYVVEDALAKQELEEIFVDQQEHVSIYL